MSAAGDKQIAMYAVITATQLTFQLHWSSAVYMYTYAVERV